MNHSAHKALLASAILFVWLSLNACSSNISNAVPARQSQSTLVFTFSESPQYGQALPGGAFRYAGVIVASAGLDPTEPLVLVVEDGDGLVSRMNVKEMLDIHTSYIQSSSLDLQTGTFVVDGIDDFYIDAGEKTLSLIAKDALGQQVVYSTANNVGPLMVPTGSEFGSSRAHWTAQVLKFATQYANMLNGYTFEGDLAENLTVDRDLLTAILGHMQNRVQAENTVGWAESAIALEVQVAEIFDAHPTSDPAELALRENVRRQFGWERFWCERWTSIADGIQVRGRFQLPGGNQRLARHTFHENAIFQVQRTPTASGEVLDARIFFDDGVPHYCTGWPEVYDPGVIEPGTADPDNPAWHLIITLDDQDNNGAIDSFEVEGEARDPESGQMEPFEDPTNLMGHLIAPLRHLEETCFLMGNGG